MVDQGGTYKAEKDDDNNDDDDDDDMDTVYVDVLVMGGGVGGCSAAHRLIMDPMFTNKKIMLIEAGSAIGGMARSGEIPNTGTDGRRNLPTEYSWRVIGSDYAVLLQIWRDIPDPDPFMVDNEDDIDDDEKERKSDDRGRTVEKNWVKISDPFWFVSTNGTSLRVWASLQSALDYAAGFVPQMSWSERFHLVNKLLYGLTCCRERRDTELTMIAWPTYLEPCPSVAEPFLIRATAPVLGVDMYKTSAAAVFEYMEHWMANSEDPLDGTYVANKPFSEALFDPWHRHLAKRGVQIFCRARILSLHADSDNRSVASAHVEINEEDGRHFRIIRVVARHYINALPVEQTVQILPSQYPGPGGGGGVGGLSRLRRLATIVRQEMVGIQLYWNQPVCFHEPHTGVFLADSPWQILIESQGALWAHNQATECESKPTFIGRHYGDGAVQDIWTLTLCDQNRPGLVYRKPWTELSRSEIYRDVWAQILANGPLVAACRGGVNGAKMGNRVGDLRPVRWHLWDSWQTSPITGRMDSSEPKLSPNAGSYPLLPDTQSAYSNMLFAAVWAHCPRTKMMRMETAASNGFAAAEVVLKKTTNPLKSSLLHLKRRYHAPRTYRQPAPRAFPVMFAPVRIMDRILYQVGIRPMFGLSPLMFLLVCTSVLMYFFYTYVLL